MNKFLNGILDFSLVVDRGNVQSILVFSQQKYQWWPPNVLNSHHFNSSHLIPPQIHYVLQHEAIACRQQRVHSKPLDTGKVLIHPWLKTQAKSIYFRRDKKWDTPWTSSDASTAVRQMSTFSNIAQYGNLARSYGNFSIQQPLIQLLNMATFTFSPPKFKFYQHDQGVCEFSQCSTCSHPTLQWTDFGNFCFSCQNIAFGLQYAGILKSKMGKVARGQPKTLWGCPERNGVVHSIHQLISSISSVVFSKF
jgi:hypothetical protein